MPVIADSGKSRSLSYQAWKRFKKNKVAMFGLFVIGFSTIIAILGPLVQPDSTPNANEMALQLTTKKQIGRASCRERV